jgi:hypothetical protein
VTPRTAATADARAALEEGIRRFEAGDPVAAHGFFGEAHRCDPREPRVASWYGVTLVLVERNSNLGVLYCDQALRLVGPTPELCLNQARAYLALGQRARAVGAVQRGLVANPGDPSLRAALESLGRRREPVIPFLSRANPVNRWLGLMRHRLGGSQPGGAATPLQLGLPPPPVRGPRDA